MCRRNPFSARRLAIERLETRSLMAADVTLSNGLLRVQGTDGDDDIFVFPANITDPRTGTVLERIRAIVRDGDSGQVLVDRVFFAWAVDEIMVECFGGNDWAENGTSKRATMLGGSG